MYFDEIRNKKVSFNVKNEKMSCKGKMRLDTAK